MGVRLFGGGQAAPRGKSGVLSLVGMAPVLSPNVLKSPRLATLSSVRSGAPVGWAAAMHANTVATARPNLLMFFMTFFLSFPSGNHLVFGCIKLRPASRLGE